MNLIQRLAEKGLIDPPDYILSNMSYLTIMGSTAYGCADTNEDVPSDWDVYGFFIPPKEQIFPHLKGAVWGFGKYHQGIPEEERKKWTWEKHHIFDKSAVGGRGREYDLHLYNIVHFVHLCTENNPNMVTSLFTPETCVQHCTAVGTLLRDQRKGFFTQEIVPRFKGYAYQQLYKLKTKEPEPGTARDVLIKKFGFDVKFAYHIVRLAEEAMQILTTGDVDLQQSRELYKTIRRGDWTLEQIIGYFEKKKILLEEMVSRCKLPPKPDWGWSGRLLAQALEMHYSDVSDGVHVPDKAEALVDEIKDLIAARGF